MTGRERIFAMYEGREPDHLPLMPITMMFAADHAGVKYGAYARDHRVLAEAQARTAETYGFDYVSAISDPAREAADLGGAIEWFDDQPPAIDERRALLGDKSKLASLRPIIGGRMTDRIAGVAALKQRAGGELLVEGWVEGPCALGADLRGINALMTDFVDDPPFVRDLFGFAVDFELAFAEAQIAAGADLIGVGDAAASLVGPKLYEEFVWPEEKRLIDGLHSAGAGVRLHICGRTRRISAGMGRLGAEQVDLDFLNPMGEARRAIGPNQVLAGNVEPVGVLRNGTPETVRAAVARCRREAGGRYIVSAGCEVCRDTPEANLRALCEYATEHPAAAQRKSD